MRTRAEKHVELSNLPLFSSAFEAPPAAPAAAAAGADNAGEDAAAAGDAAGNAAPQQQQQAQPQLFGMPALLPANHPVVQEQVQAEIRPHFKVLTAAALLGGWWGEAEHSAESRAAGLAAVRDAVGDEVATCVKRITA
jgi:hypothetical protein